MLRRLGKTICGALALAALLAGCGGGGGNPQATALHPSGALRTSSLSKAAFLKRATALCVRERERSQGAYRRYFSSHGVALSPTNLHRSIVENARGLFSSVTVPTYRHELEGIRALGAPKGDEGRVAKILNAIEQGVESARANPVEYFYKDLGRNPLHPAYLLADPYGLGPCAL